MKAVRWTCNDAAILKINWRSDWAFPSNHPGFARLSCWVWSLLSWLITLLQQNSQIHNNRQFVYNRLYHWSRQDNRADMVNASNCNISCIATTRIFNTWCGSQYHSRYYFIRSFALRRGHTFVRTGFLYRIFHHWNQCKTVREKFVSVQFLILSWARTHRCSSTVHQCDRHMNTATYLLFAYSVIIIA